MIKQLLNSNACIEFHHHGLGLDPVIEKINFGDALKLWPLHNRANNPTAYYKGDDKKHEELQCIMNMEVPVMLPNGDLLLCSQDFGAECIIGNLYSDKPMNIFEGKSYKSMKQALLDETNDTICRYCRFAVDKAIHKTKE